MTKNLHSTLRLRWLTGFIMALLLLGSGEAWAQTIVSELFDGAWTTPTTLSTSGATGTWGDGGATGDQQWHRNDYTTGWTSTSGSPSTTGVGSTGNYARFHSYDAASGMMGSLISPTLNFSGYSASKVLSFYMINTGGADVVNVFLSTDNGVTYSMLGTYGVYSSFTQLAINLGATTSATVKVKFTATSDFGITDIGIDNFQVSNAVTTAVCGTKSIGPSAGADYASLTAAFAAAAANGLCGPLTLELQPAYVCTVETFPLAYSYIPGISSVNTVTVRPQGGATPAINLSITSANTTATFNINSGKYLIIDGRPGGSGSTVSGAAATTDLIIANTSTSSIPLTFANDAQNNTVQHCQVKGVGSSTAYPDINFASATSSVGNSNNTIQYNNIGDGATSPAVLVYSGAALNASNTVKNNNLFNFYYSGTTTAAAVYLGSAGAGWVISNNSLYQTASRTPGSSTTQYGLYLGSGTNALVSGNAIGGTAPATIPGTGAATLSGTWTVSGTAASYRFVGIYASSTTPTVQNNTIGNMSWYSSSGATTAPGTWAGVYVLTTANVQGNTIGSGITVTNTTSGSISYGIVSSSGPTTLNVNGNTIAGITMAGSTTSIANSVAGIQTGGTTNNVYQNKIYGLAAANAGVATGILSFAGTTTAIYNNLMASLTAPASTSLLAVAGISITAGSAVNAYYNTIYLNATSTGATFGTSGIFLNSTSTVLDLRDNIVVNASASAGTGGSAVALRRVSGTAATVPVNYATSANNNLFYAGSPSATNLIYAEGTATATNAQPTLVAFKAFMGNRDQASITENPTFVSTTGAGLTFLHINPAVATQVESSGAAISGITTDFDGDTRNATTPDVGADEGAFTPSDQSPPTITYTALGNTGGTATRTLTATITDMSGVATGAGVPLLYFRKGTSGPYFSAGATSSAGSSYTFPLSSATLGGVVVGDVVQYYVAAQDASANNNVATSPSGGAGISPPGSTPPGTPNAYTIVPSLAGTYYVGTGTACGAPAYATLTAAAAAYNTYALAGAVSFVLVDNTYASETYPITFNANPDASATNALTIKPCGSAVPVFSGSSSGPLIRLNGTSYATLDGSNNGTTSQNWSLTNTNTNTTAGLVQLGSNAAGAAPANNTVKNLVLNGLASAAAFTTSFGIQLAVASPATTGASNNTFQNNAITKVQTGISAVGLSATVRDVNTTIANNQIGSATAAAGFGGATALGITASNQTTLTITGNVVRNPVIVAAGANPIGATALISASTLIGIDLSSTVTTATVSNNTVRDLLTSGGSLSSSPTAGIRLGTTVVGATVNANLVTNLKTTAAAGYGSYGIYVNTSTASASAVVSNNMVSDINGSNYSTFTGSSSAGIYLNSTQSGISVVYNSVNMYGTSTYSSAVNTAALAVETGSTGLTVRNNVLSNSLVASTALSLPFSFYSNAPASAYTVINNNDCYSSGSQATDPVMFRLSGTNGTTLAALRTATSQDAASISADPAFALPNDLHASAAALDGAAASIAGITTDIDGQTRNAATPDIGADEFTPSTLDLKPTALVAPTATQYCFGSTEPVTVTIQNNAGAPLNFALNNATVTVSVTGAATQSFTVTLTSGTLAPGATQSVALGALDMTALGTYTFATTATAVGDVNTANDVLAPTPTRTNAVVQAALPYLEAFNSSTLPTNFATTGFYTSTAANTGGATGSYGLRVNIYSSTPSAMATTPVVGTTISSNNVLTFDARFLVFGSTTGYVLTGTDRIDVQVATCGGPFTTVYTINSANFNGSGAASGSFYTYNVPLTGVVSGQKIQVRLAAAYGSASGDYYVDVDNINVRSLAVTDLAATALVNPTTTQGCYGSAETVTVTVKNQGVNTLDFSLNAATVMATVTGAATATLTGTLTSGTLAAGATQNVVLTPTLDMSAYGAYTFAISATVTGDQNPANDALTPNPVITTVAPVAGTLSPAAFAICQSGTATLVLDGAVNGTIQYQSSSDGTTFTDISGATSATYTTPVLTSTTYFRAQTRCGVNSATANVATVTVNNPLITATNTPVVICSGSSAALTATANAGSIIRWYDTNASTTVLTTGGAYATPALTVARQYFVAAVVSNGSTNTTGLPSNAATYGTYSQSTLTDYPLGIKVTQPGTLASVDVYPTTSGALTIRLYATASPQPAAAGAQVGSDVTLTVTAAQVGTKVTVPLGISLVAGDYKLTNTIGTVGRFSSYSGAYPLSSGPISVLGSYFASSSTTFSNLSYNSFFNLTFTTDCVSARTAVQVNVTPVATANAGMAPAGVCAGGTYATTGSFGGSATGATYTSSGSGGFSNAGVIDGSTTSVSYSPSAADLTAGSVTLTLTTSGPCATATSTLLLTMNATTYTGAAAGDGNNWFNAANWTACVPASTVDALIPAGLANYPMLGTAATAEVRSLTLNNGASLAQSAGTLNVYRNLTSNTPAANIALTGGMLAFVGSTPTMTGLSSAYNLAVSLSSAVGTLTLANNVTVTSSLTLTQGILSTGSYAVVLAPKALIAESDASYVLGQVTVAGRTLSTATAETFGNIGLTLTPDAASAAFPGTTTVVRTTGTALTGAGSSVSVKRWFRVTPAVDANLTMTLKMDLFEHERNGIVNSNLLLFSSPSPAGGGSPTAGTWAPHASSVLASPSTVAYATAVVLSGLTHLSDWTLGNRAAPLPVELAAFTASRQGTNAALAWTTASEKSSRGFEVQASADGRVFFLLEFVASVTPSSISPRSYTYLDRAAGKTGLRYYRLRHLDLDGTSSFTPVCTVRFDGESILHLTAAPNPFRERLTLRVELPVGVVAAPAQLSLTDAAGRTLLQQLTPALPAGLSLLELPDLTNLTSGVYLVNLSVPGHPVHHLKVMKE